MQHDGSSEQLTHKRHKVITKTEDICQWTQTLNDIWLKVKSIFYPNHLNITIFSAILEKENKLGNKLYIHNTVHHISPAVDLFSSNSLNR